MSSETVPHAAPTDAVLRAPAPPPAITARPHRRTALWVVLGFAALLALWWGSSFVLAYTDDAFLTSDWVAIAPEVTGPVIAVHIHDNQLMKRGEPLFSIDPVPFRLEVAQAVAAVRQAEAQLPVDQAELATALASQQSAGAEEVLAAVTEARLRALAGSADAPVQRLDDAVAQHRQAIAHVQSAAAEVLRVEQTVKLHQAAIEAARAALATAQWRLDRTEIVAPVDGPVSNLKMRVGDMAIAHEPLLGIVDAQAWRVVANYKEYVLRHLKPGTRAWVWLDAVPWHIYRAHVQGVSHAIGRDPAAPNLLPYVDPTVNWIRLSRRVPVRIEIEDPPPNMHLFMGSDARTLVFY